MFLFHYGRIITYKRMRESWRGVVLAFFAAAGLLSPSGVFTMLIVAIPLGLTYLFGLGILWIYTRFERRAPRTSGEPAD
jgi:sec-independent protein translocase protein TatC